MVFFLDINSWKNPGQNNWGCVCSLMNFKYIKKLKKKRNKSLKTHCFFGKTTRKMMNSHLKKVASSVITIVCCWFYSTILMTTSGWKKINLWVWKTGIENYFCFPLVSRTPRCDSWKEQNNSKIGISLDFW